MEMINSAAGAKMIDAQRDSRRQRHIAALKESQKFIDQFYNNFSERKNEIRERSRVFTMASDSEIADLMATLTDANLCANEITFLNGVWDKVVQHRNARKTDTNQLRQDFDDLKAYQAKGSTGFLNTLRQQLLDIAFLLEPAVDKLMVDYLEEDARKYAAEHEECDNYYTEVTTSDVQKFEQHYLNYKEAGVRFHKLKQEDAIQTFLDKMNSLDFVNPVSRKAVFADMRAEQQNLFDQRSAIINELHMTRPTAMTVAFVSN